MLTDSKVRALPIPDVDQLVPAGGRDGLYLRLRASGRKTWVIRRRIDGKWRVETVGDFPKVTAKMARAAAGSEQALASSPLTFKDAAQTFAEEVIEARYRRAPQDTKAYLTRDCAELASRRLDRVRMGDITRIIRTKAADHPAAAGRLLAVLKQFFKWATVGELISSNPIADLTAKSLHLPGYEPRERVLSDDEIRAVWLLPDEPYGRLLRFNLLTGCRIGEALAFEPEQLKSDVWTIPETKNGRAHALPLAGAALALATAGWPRRTYKALHSAMRLAGMQWNLHDLRRSAATRMRDAGVPVEAIEAVLNHKPPRLVRTYQRPDMMPAMRQALERLEKTIQAVANPTPGGSPVTCADVDPR